MFITLEGPEGSGKTTAVEFAVNKLLEMGYEIVRTREPGGTIISEQIRNVILDKANTAMDARTEALLYAASRRQHLVEKIWPALKAGKIVICDRYLDSSLAYQGGARELGIEEVLKVNLFATENTWPDLTLLFDIDPIIGLSRISSNNQREVNRLDLEKLDFHKKVRATFLKLAKQYPERYAIIDASKSREEVANATLDAILSRLCK
ncbi:MAG: dTMP kinase [Bacilli bacterium]|jgi:dTMP kinase|nr:dTMP kinase [Bacilli bacterium]MDD3068632.1 dTMP kinase [Bacilli bacterium]MDD3841138.1 dTMP kinase [Bacilli bacterium]HKM10114.1 dTMP kinase [Bacilli bacterium]